MFRAAIFDLCGQIGPGNLHAVSAHRQNCGRHLHHPLDAHRADQSRSGAHVHEQRQSISGRPSMGSWLTYGLGGDCENLPGFVVLTSSGGDKISRFLRGNGTADFCRAVFRAFNFSRKATGSLHRQSARAFREHAARGHRRRPIALNRKLDGRLHDPEIATRIASMKWRSRCNRACRNSRNFRGTAKRARHVRHQSRAMAPLPRIVYWRDGSPNAACDSSNFIIAIGIITADIKNSIATKSGRRWTRLPPRS